MMGSAGMAAQGLLEWWNRVSSPSVSAHLLLSLFIVFCEWEGINNGNPLFLIFLSIFSGWKIGNSCQQLAQQMQAQNPELVEQLRRQMGGGGGPGSSDPGSEPGSNADWIDWLVLSSEFFSLFLFPSPSSLGSTFHRLCCPFFLPIHVLIQLRRHFFLL